MTPPPASTARAAADLRLLRAAVFTAVCVALSAGGHILASCATVPLWTLGVAAAAVFAVAATLAGRERTLPGIAVGLALGQLALHALFAWGQQPPPSVARSGSGVAGLSDQAAISLARHLTCGLGTGRLDGAQARRALGSGGLDTASAAGVAAPAGHGTAGATATADPVVHGLLPSLPMLLGHLLAALAVGWLLRRGEAALWRLVRLSAPAAYEMTVRTLAGAVRTALVLVRALLTGLGAAHDEARRAPVSYGDDKPGPKDLALHHSVVRRGPPTLALAA
ncbi:hypothetical protein HEP86_21190 [Streptomyces sp. RPA4-5]|uniref:hypothetical protein n=1 Tax=Streptomyces TaxID=1883 RepID=UPI00143EC501|nr:MULTISPECIES: hypothetical protein [Streptomyces]MCX4639508.1 hypothetical protein [Streptomyces platensis]QIY56590.1 hypothetical protein HEP86_21190 [Streptomyces sp. RPA4-5]WJY39496.1 hypothetical protein QT196_20625 [Streptomyces sp. P9-2B-2]